ncbi:phosphatase PAP2 family protein [bacterium]|nr:phosphatase PAP2 family protein [bacterium]
MQTTPRPLNPKTVPELLPGLLPGYLDMKTLPDSLALIPPAPELDSAEFALDQGTSQSYLKLRGTARWDLAKKDANLHFPEAAGTFSCALNAPVTETETPYLYQMLRRTKMDAGMSTYNAKDEYERVRPFMQNNEPSCTPEEESRLKWSGSYPSGHAAIGWAWALILSEIAPDRVEKIMARGRAFGESRVFCNLHWDSDVREGRIVADAVVAKLHSDPGFRYDLAVAKEEIAAVREKKLPPTRDCQDEAAALAVHPQ